MGAGWHFAWTECVCTCGCVLNENPVYLPGDPAVSMYYVRVCVDEYHVCVYLYLMLYESLYVCLCDVYVCE
jgi:hypothetical protein